MHLSGRRAGMTPRRRTLPQESATLMNRAVAAHEQGDTARAEAGYRELVRLHPEFGDAWHLLGLLHHQRGDARSALESLQRAQTLDPDNVEFLLNFARVLHEQGNLAHALGFVERANALQPDHAQALALRAEILLSLSRGDEAVPALERRLGDRGDDWYLWMLLGACREQGGNRPGAFEALARAVALAPADEPLPYLRRAESAFDGARYDQARADFEHVLDIAPQTAAALCGLAQLEALEGRFEECVRLARQALAADPDYVQAWALIAEARGRDIDAGLARELEREARRAEDKDSAWPLHYALGRSREQLGDHDRAFDAYARANRIVARHRRYVPQNNETHARGLMAHLDEAFLSRHAALAQRASSGIPAPIFICGMPRSGTTLVESVLASHPQVAAGGEMRYLQDSLKRILGNRGASTGMGEWLGHAGAEALAALAEGWDRALLEKSRQLPYVTDKMPSNFNLLPLIHVCYPHSPVIYVKRDARDTCMSCFSLYFKEGNHFSYTQEGLAHYYKLHESIVDRWRALLPAGRIIEVGYEALVRDPEPGIRRLLEAVGLPWDPRCLDFHNTRRTVTTASFYQVRQPIYGSSIGRWRHFERHLGPLLSGLEADPPL